MPHLVSTFLRNSSNSFEAQVANIKKATGTRRPSPKPSPSSSSASSLRQHTINSAQRTPSYASSVDDDVDYVPPPPAHNMKAMATVQRSASSERKSDLAHIQPDHHHRLSFGALHFGRTSRETHVSPNVVLSWKIESPPIVLYGDVESSTGALVSGLLFIAIKDEPVEMESFTAKLNIHVTQKRPYTAHCQDCINQYTLVEKWNLLQGPLKLSKGEHGYPFSVLLPGHLPASQDGQLVSIAYEFQACAVPKPGAGSPVKLEKVFNVKRSLPTPELPHHSVRVFPPTNIKASVHFPQVIHPIGQNTLSLRIDGITRLNSKVSTLEYWKLKKLTWRLEETSKTVAPACKLHAPAEPKDADEAGESALLKKGIQRTDTRVIGEKTLLTGWKSNYAGPDDSSIELELDYMLGKNARYSCDSKSKDGTEITHQLMVEMVVSQEWAPVGKPGMITQTGVGRILRMHFNDILTERGGIGVSWDNEAPPIYQDVPPSPPSYCEELGNIITDHLEPLDGEGSGRTSTSS